MRVLMINVTCGSGSTGRICTDLADVLENEGHTVKIAYGRGYVSEKHLKYAVRIGNDVDVYSHVFKARLCDRMGFGSERATRKFINWVKEYDPDVIHLHNIHGYYINIKILFAYLKVCKKKIIWTLHDCWSFTGHCAFFDYVECNKWITGCSNCPQKNTYPSRIGVDMSEKNYFEKKSLFTSIPNLTIVTPSEWLANLIKQSFLRDYPVEIVNNGINTDVFRNVKTDIKEKNGIANEKKIVLGIASVWDKRKGLDDFIQLSTLLDDEYQIVLIGLNEKQISKLPESIIGITRTENVNELVEWYSAAYVFINPTFEDNYPTTNIEAISCGTPVISYNTGGSRESALLYGCVTTEKTPQSIVSSITELGYLPKNKKDISYESMLQKYLMLYPSI